METLKRFSAGTAEVVFGWVVGTAGFAYHLSFFLLPDRALFPWVREVPLDGLGFFGDPEQEYFRKDDQPDRDNHGNDHRS